jgi:hypothetical protein
MVGKWSGAKKNLHLSVFQNGDAGGTQNQLGILHFFCSQEKWMANLQTPIFNT